MLGPVPEGQRNDTATRLAGLLLVKGLTAAQTEILLTPWARAVCVPPMDPRELKTTVQSVARREAVRRHSAGPPEGRFTKGLSELLTVPDEPVAYLVERLLVAASNGFIGGEPKSLKSWLALYLALCLAVGVPAFGRYSVPAPVRVLYFQEEDGERRVRRRVRRLLKAMGAEPPSDSVFRYSIKAGLLLDDDQWMEALRAELAAYRPAVVFADVFELMHSKDSDRRAELKPILYRLDRLREEFQCGFVLVDHFKTASFGISRRGGQRLAGTVGKHAWGECSLYLFPGQGKNQVRVETELKDGPSEAFGLTLEDTPEGGVAFRWEPEATDRAAEMKAKILEAVEGLASPEGWVTAKQVAEAAGVSGNTASKWLTVLADEDGKLVREKQQVGKTKAFHYRLRA
jgi:RecA-family ATPase